MPQLTLGYCSVHWSEYYTNHSCSINKIKKINNF